MVKLKVAGVIEARATTDAPTARLADYVVTWQTGLRFRNSTATMAVCVTKKGKDPASTGLHLSTDAAEELGNDLRSAAAKEGSVDVVNHKAGEPSLWARFSSVDAVGLAWALDEAIVPA